MVAAYDVVAAMTKDPASKSKLRGGVLRRIRRKRQLVNLSLMLPAASETSSPTCLVLPET